MKEQNLAIDTFVPALRTLAGVLDKGAAHAREKGTDPQALLQERLAPDMFPLSSQIQLPAITPRMAPRAPPARNHPRSTSRS
jgi:hypothetical protein